MTGIDVKALLDRIRELELQRNRALVRVSKQRARAEMWRQRAMRRKR